MPANIRRFTTLTSFLGRIGDWFKHAWGIIQPGPLAWKGAAVGLLVVAVSFTLIAAYPVFLAQPRIVSFLVGSAKFIAIAAVVGALLVLLAALLGIALYTLLVSASASVMRAPLKSSLALFGYHFAARIRTAGFMLRRIESGYRWKWRDAFISLDKR